MLKRAAATATAAVSAAVSTIGGGGVGDEQFDSYRSRVEGLQRDMANLKDKCGLFSKAAMNMAVSGGEVGGEFRALYRSSAPRQAMVDKFGSVQQRIDEAAFRAFSIDTFGSAVLGVLDEWQTDSQRVLDDIRNAETALDEVRKLQDKVAAGKAGRDRRQAGGSGGASNSQDAMLQQAEEMLARFEKNLTTQRAELDKRVNGFVDGRYAVLDSVFVRFMELQTEFAQSLVTATATFAPSIAAYRKKVPLGSTGPLSPRTSVGNGSLSPSGSQHSLSPSTDMFASAAAASASASNSAAGRPSFEASQPRKTASPAKTATDDDDESSEEDDSDSDDSEDDDSDDEDDAPRSSHNHSKAKAAPPGAGKLASPRVSTGAAGSTSPRNSQPSSPTDGTAPSGSRSTTASPDLLNFGGGDKSGNNNDDLMDLFSGAAKTASSPTNKKQSAASNNAAPADDLSLFDFSGPAKQASHAPSASAAASSSSSSSSRAAGGKQQQPSHSSSMDFDPLAASSQPVAAKPTSGAASAAPASSSSSAGSRQSSSLPREDSRSALNAVAKGMVKTDELDRHIEDQQERRLEELRANEEEQLKDAADKKAATHVLEDKLNAWSTKEGQRKNIRLLLSSLHTVLWPNSGWKPAGLADLIDLNAIKKQHRKAILIVHPDKLQDATPEQKVIAEHAFDALNTGQLVACARVACMCLRRLHASSSHDSVRAHAALVWLRVAFQPSTASRRRDSNTQPHRTLHNTTQHDTARGALAVSLERRRRRAEGEGRLCCSGGWLAVRLYVASTLWRRRAGDV